MKLMNSLCGTVRWLVVVKKILFQKSIFSDKKLVQHVTIHEFYGYVHCHICRSVNALQNPFLPCTSANIM